MYHYLAEVDDLPVIPLNQSQGGTYVTAGDKLTQYRRKGIDPPQ
jgi:hypothetical protein